MFVRTQVCISTACCHAKERPHQYDNYSDEHQAAVDAVATG
ncbi:hypothetical protein [Faecalibacterium hattorii]